MRRVTRTPSLDTARRVRLRCGSLLFAGAVGSASLLATTRAEAAPPWVDRRLTLPEHDWAFDGGLGIGHYDFGPLPNGQRASGTGPGLSFEGAVSVVRHLELGFRGGFRFGNDARAAQADNYGRLFDRETYGTRTDTAANPEFRIRGELIDLEIIELALEGRVWMPIEDQSRFGMMFGVPLAFHLGSTVRLDTGAYVPVLFYDQTVTAISVPVDVWFQVNEKLWLGPLTGFEIDNPGGHGHLSAGFGLGYQVLSFLDFKTMFLWPRIDQRYGPSNFGLGAGVQVRIE